MVNPNPDIKHLPEHPTNRPSYLLIKNGTLFKLYHPSEVIHILNTLTAKDEILMRDNIGRLQAPICVKFAGTKSCIASPFFADIVIERGNTGFRYIPFGYDRTLDDTDSTLISTSWGKVKCVNNTRKLDAWFNDLWDTMLINPNEDGAVKLK